MRNSEFVAPGSFSPPGTGRELNRWELFMRCTAGSQAHGTALSTADFPSLLTTKVRVELAHSVSSLARPQSLQQTQGLRPSSSPSTCMTEPPMASGGFGLNAKLAVSQHAQMRVKPRYSVGVLKHLTACSSEGT